MQVMVLHLWNSPFMYEIFMESWSFKFDQGKHQYPELQRCWAYFRSEVCCWRFQFPLTDISLLVIVGFKVNIVHILVNTLTCIFWLIKLIYFNIHIETLVGFLFIAYFNKVILSPPPCGWSWFSGLYNANYLHRSFFSPNIFKIPSLWQRKKIVYFRCMVRFDKGIECILVIHTGKGLLTWKERMLTMVIQHMSQT